MKTTRRGFLATLGAAAMGAGPTSGDAQPAGEIAPPRKIRGAKMTTTICPFCSVGCGLVVSAKDGKVVNIEGDREHPISEGRLCSKGMALIQTVNNPRRLNAVLYRAPGSDRWEEKPWDWAIPEIARRIKATRDATFQRRVDGRSVNRTEAIASLGGSTLHNDECYLYTKLMRSLGIVYLEHQARI